MKVISPEHLLPGSAASSSAITLLPPSSRRQFLKAARACVAVIALVGAVLFAAPDAYGYCSQTSATEVCLEHTLPVLPAGGGKFTDPDFGTQVMRLTDSGDDPSFCTTPYSYWPAFNHDATRVMVQCNSGIYFYAFDPVAFTRGARTTYAPPPGTPAMDFGNGYYWSKTDSNLVYAFASVNTKLYSYNVSTGQQSVVHDFAPDIGAGRYVVQPSMSDDLSVIGFTVKNSADYSNYGYMVYNLTTSTVLLYVNDTRINEVHVSKNGQYASVDLDGPQAVRVWNLSNTSSSQYLLYYDPGPPASEGLSHNTTKSNFIVGFTAAMTSTVSRWEFTNLQRTTLLPLSYSHTGTAHISGLMDDDNWALVSISDGQPATLAAGYDASATTISVVAGQGQRLPTNVQFDAVWWNQTDYPRGPASDPNGEVVHVTGNSNDTLTVVRGQQGTAATPKNTPGKSYRLLPTGPFHGEIFLVKTDGSGGVRRFVHHRAQLISYYDSNFGNVSRDGNYVAFASNWDNTGRHDLFIARVPSASPPPGGDQAVVWTNVSNATTGANGAITKTPNGSDWPPGTADSTQSLSGDGYFDCYVNNNGAPNLYPMNVGLNSGDNTTFEYYWGVSSGYAQPYVNNTYKASTPVTTGDKLRIAVEGGVVKFYKNAELVYTSDVAPSYPLKARFSAGLDNAGITSATISAGSSTATWTNVSNATTGAVGAITKTPNGSDWPPGRGDTAQALSGDGSFDCVVNNNGAPNLYPMNVGLNSGNTGTVEYYWAISSGYAMPYVNNTYQASTPVTTSDHLKIAIEGGVVKFYKNAELIYTSDLAPSYPLKGYFSAGLDNAGLTSASFVGAN
jgi:hypothetical protein